jgi:hypothetical protein
MKSQLFKKDPCDNIIEKLLNCFGLENINDYRHFSREDLKKIDSVNKIYKIKEELNKYYIPCKARTYLNDLNEKNIITILKQFLKNKGYTVISREKYSKKKKFIIYKLLPLIINNYQPIDTKKLLCINFE